MVSLVVVILLYERFSTFAKSISMDSDSRWLIGIALSVGTYVVLFRALVYMLEKFILPRLNPRDQIFGRWSYDITRVTGGSFTSSGVCEIVKRPDKAEFIGHHTSEGDIERRSSFISTAVFQDDDRITLIYVSSGVDSDIFSRSGIMHLTAQGSPPTTIQGVWFDTMPAVNRGDIRFERLNN